MLCDVCDMDMMMSEDILNRRKYMENYLQGNGYFAGNEYKRKIIFSVFAFIALVVIFVAVAYLLLKYSEVN